MGCLGVFTNVESESFRGPAARNFEHSRHETQTACKGAESVARDRLALAEQFRQLPVAGQNRRRCRGARRIPCWLAFACEAHYPSDLAEMFSEMKSKYGRIKIRRH